MTEPALVLNGRHKLLERSRRFIAEQSAVEDSDWMAGLARDDNSPLDERSVELFDDEQIQDIPEPEWLVPGVIPGNALAQLFGPSEAYKTFIAIDLACHIATGLEWHGRRVARGNVVYVMAEGVHGAKHRVAAWKKYQGVTGKIGVYFVRHRIEVASGSPDVQRLLAAVEARLPEAPVLIVVDTLARNMRGNESATEDMNDFIAGCDSLRLSTDATVLYVHHPGWSEADRGRGNSSNHCAVDTDIQATRDGNRVTLKCRKQKDAEHFPDLRFEAITLGNSLVLKPVDQAGGKLDGNRLLCLRVVHRSEGGLTHSQWMKEADLTRKKSSFNDARDWLVTNAYVKHGADKKYVITDAGNQAIGPRSTCGPSQVQNGESQLVQHAGVFIDPAVDQDRSGQAA